jgi:hypothetical protein
LSNAEKFREYAGECRRLAAQIRDPELKAIANELMAGWLALAGSAASADVVLVVTEHNTDADDDEPVSLL